MFTLAQHLTRLQARNYDWPIPWEAVSMMCTKEGCYFTAYLCPAKKWTIGWGETEGVKPGDTCDGDWADKRVFDELKTYAASVKQMCTLTPTPNQLGALCSLAYNIGLGGPKDKKGLFKSSVLRLHNQGNYAAAARAFNLYNKATVNGVLVEEPGLTSRRAEEAAIYLRPEPDVPQQVMVQDVQPESNIAVSPTNVGGAVAVATGALTTLSTVSDQVSPVIASTVQTVQTVATTLNLQPVYVVGAVMIGVGVYIIFQRLKQRSGGWA